MRHDDDEPEMTPEEEAKADHDADVVMALLVGQADGRCGICGKRTLTIKNAYLLAMPSTEGEVFVAIHLDCAEEGERLADKALKMLVAGTLPPRPTP